MNFCFEPSVAVPYPGLRPFLRGESQVFFGRDRQIDDILGRLKRNQFLGVVGTSGCGKSSLIRAGILPALEAGRMGEIGSSWHVADMKPGDTPLANLASALIKCGVLGARWPDTPEGTAVLTAALRRSDLALVDLIRELLLPPHTSLLVLADQFEEIFRFQQRDANEALAFVNLLLTAGRDRTAPIYVVLTMRTDFLGSCALFPGLPEALNDSQYLCPRLSRDQLKEAIEGPASVFGGEVEPALVTQIVNDAGANSDTLPLVQHVLARMWHRFMGEGHGTVAGRTELVLRLDDYRRVGGLKGDPTRRDSWTGSPWPRGRQSDGGSSQNALSQHADEAYFDLRDDAPASADRGPEHKPSPRQRIAHMLFRCLAERGPSGQFVRRPVKVRDVAEIAGGTLPEVIEVVEVFRREDRSFLTPAKPKQDDPGPEGSDLGPDTMLDISHEALIRQWRRFGAQGEQLGERASAQSWLEIEEQSRRRYRRLAEAAENRETAGLLRSPELEFLHAWWEEYRPTPAWAETCAKGSFDRTGKLLQDSLAKAEEDERKQKAAEKEKQAAAEQRAKLKRSHRVNVVFAVLCLVTVGFGVSAYRNRLLAEKNEAAARKSAALAEENAKQANAERDRATKAEERSIAAARAAQEERDRATEAERLFRAAAEIAQQERDRATKAERLSIAAAKTAQAERDRATEAVRLSLAAAQTAQAERDRATEAERQSREAADRAIAAEKAAQMELDRAIHAVQRAEAAAFQNTLGMKFVPVPGTKVLFSIWHTRVADYEKFAAETHREWPKPAYAQAPSHPVANVSWHDAQAFCAWLTKKEKAARRLEPDRKYRLPTDAEWSVAVGLVEAPGGTPESKDRRIKEVYPWGKQWPPPLGAGNYEATLKVDEFAKTSPAGSFVENKFGLYDMGGNVYQWCEDVYDAKVGTRVMRGASFDDYIDIVLLSSRRGYFAPDGRDGNIGFRCVIEVASAP